MSVTRTLIHASANALPLRDESVQCVVTSPPYWGLRQYAGEQTVAWPDGSTHPLGLEPTPELYVAHMVEVFREVRRVLRADGTLWLNLGDSYAGGRSGPNGVNGEMANREVAQHRGMLGVTKQADGLKNKDLVGIPWMVAKALQAPYYTGRIKAETDRVWLAAMIDGEGCMFLHKRKAGQSNGQGYERKRDSYGAGLEVSNTSEAIVRRCMEIAGAGSIMRHEKARRQPLYRWNIRSNQCREVIREVYPYLVGKQQQARLLLGCPSSGADAESAHASLMALHNGEAPTIDFAPPASMYEPGWYLRSDIIWSKLNPMPESVTDRPTKAHEYLFLLSKSERYFYDADAIREPAIYAGTVVKASDPDTAKNGQKGQYGATALGFTQHDTVVAEGRNKRTVWNIATRPYGAVPARRVGVGGTDRKWSRGCPVHEDQRHLDATDECGEPLAVSPSDHTTHTDDRRAQSPLGEHAPTALLLAVDSPLGSSGSLPLVSAPTATLHSMGTRRTGLDLETSQRETDGAELAFRTGDSEPSPERAASDDRTPESSIEQGSEPDGSGSYREARTAGRSACTCTSLVSVSHFAVFPEQLVEPCILAGSAAGDTILDPFNGSGTTGRVAIRHGRSYVGVDISREYLEEQATKRIDDIQHVMAGLS